MTNYQRLRDSLQQSRPMRGLYHGHIREFCVQVLGHTEQEERALVYQFGGTSGSGLQPDGSPDNLRCLRVAQIEQLEEITGSWHQPDDWSRAPHCVADVEFKHSKCPL